MSQSQRSLLVGGLVLVSVVSFIAFVVIGGSFLHTGQQAVGAVVGAPGAAPLESIPAVTNGGWVSLLVSIVMAWQSGSWAKWLAAAGKAAPLLNEVRELPQIQGLAARIRATPLSPLLSLMESIDITSGNGATSHGEYPLNGGKLEWTVKFTPADPAQ